MYIFARVIGQTRLVFIMTLILGGLLVGPGFAHLGEQSLALIDQPIGVAAGVDKVLITRPFCINETSRQVLKINSQSVKTVFAPLPNGPAGCHEDYIAISPGLGGFILNTVYVVQGAVGEGQGANVLKIPPTGATSLADVKQFAFLPGCALSGNNATFDRWGTFGFDMVVACSNGLIWRVDFNGVPTHIATVAATGPVEGIDQAPPAFRPYGTCMFVAAENDTTTIGSDSSAGTVFVVCSSGASVASGTVAAVAKWPRAEYVRFVPPIVTSCLTGGAFFQAIFPTSVFKFPQSAFSGLDGQALVASEFPSESGGIGRLQSVTDQTGSRIVVVNPPFHSNTDTLAEAQLEGAAFCGSVHLPPGAVKRNPPQLNPRSQGEYKMRIFSTPLLPDVSRIHDVKAGRFGREASAVKCELVEGGTALDCHFRTADSGFVLTDKFVPFVVITGMDQGFDGGD